jgi:two-component system LytT family response regulator
MIVDDEAVARRRIRRLLARDSGAHVVGECADGSTAVEAIVAERPDLVFLDVQMPELDGFEVLQRLPPSALSTFVFVTAFDRYALRAFDVHAVDYLLKPFTADRFAEAMHRARVRVASTGTPDASVRALVEDLRGRSRYLRRLPVRVGQRVILLDVEDIDWLQAADNYVTIHAAKREHILRSTLAELEQQLDPNRFARIHRSAIVALDRVGELHPSSHGDFEVFLRDGTRLALSRRWREQLERVLGHKL